MNKAILLLIVITLMITSSQCTDSVDAKKEIDPLTTDTISKKINWVERGREMALQTKAELGRNLIKAIQEKGTDGAIEFCSKRALQITDSMSTALGSHIKRVAEFNRNPLNRANNAELEYIQQVKAAIAAKESPKPRSIETNETFTGYYPILTDELCLQCHGDKNTMIQPATLSVINRLYPDDKATGFKLNELRGIWVVEMEK